MSKIKAAAILGLGTVGQSMAKELMAHNVEVLVADRNEELISQIAPDVTYAVSADLSDAGAIKELGLKNMDVVIVCMSRNLEASIMCIMGAKEEGVPQIIAKASSSRTVEIFRKIGADKIFQPEVEEGILTARKLLSSNFIDFFDLSENISIVDMLPMEDWIGKSMKQLDLRKKHGINVIAVISHDTVDYLADPDAPIPADCHLLVTVNNKNLNQLI